MNSELLLIPKDKLNAVLAVLEGDMSESAFRQRASIQEKPLSEDPWQGLLEDDE